MLKCCHAHEFEVWFGHSSDYDDQIKRTLISCPHCGNTEIEKAPMAPNIHSSKNSVRRAETLAQDLRHDLETNCENVGDTFSQEARAMHYGDAPERNIYGYATRKQAHELAEEGIDAIVLPDAIVPRVKTKLN